MDASPRLLSAAGLVLLAAAVGRAEPITWNATAARHLLSRTSFGASPEEVARLAALPLERAVEQLLDEAAAAEAPLRPAWVRDQWINGGRRWSDMSREEYLIILRKNGTRNQAEINDLRAWWLDHMIKSRTPLRETMTLFWHGHFTSATGKVLSFSQAFYQQNQTWRQHAMGNFRQFVEAVTLDPCMLNYLDMERSDRAHPNENYARELLELFTLGVGNYTEKDILEIARALTGWTLDAPPGTVKVNRPTDPERLQFPSITRDGMVPTFVPERHDSGPKTILGKTGNFGVKDVLDIVTQHPACAPYIASRLIAFFGAHDPDGELRERMAAAFRSSGLEIRPMLKVLFTSPEFYAPQARAAQVKSPVRLLVGACRDLKLNVTATPALAQLTAPMGQELFNPPTVKGWPGGTAWISASTLSLRQRLGDALLDSRESAPAEPLGRQRLTPVPRDPQQAAAQIRRLMAIDAERRQMAQENGIQTQFDPSRLVPTTAAENPARLVDTLLERLVVAPVRPITKQSLIAACEAVPTGQRAALVARLILASPEYQVE